MDVSTAQLMLQLGVIIFAAKICGMVAQKIKIPSVLGELAAGVIIGPYLLGAIGFGAFTHGLFPMIEGKAIPVSDTLYSLATFGSIVLLFISGLETDLRMFFRYSVAGTTVGLGGVIFSFAFGDILGMIMLDVPAMDPRALFLGILCTATSVGITARILSDKRCIDSPEGTTILAAAVIDDVLGIICLAIVTGIVGSEMSSGNVDWGNISWIAFKSVGIWLGFTALGLLLARRTAKMLKFFQQSDVIAVLALGLALLLSGIFEQCGLAMIIGAYVLGLSLSKTDITYTVQRALRSVYDLLVPIFFVVMGMMVDISVMQDESVLTFGLIYAAVAVLAKVLGCMIPALFMNFNTLGALRIGTGMIPRGEVALIIAGIGATTMMDIDGQKSAVIGSKLFGVTIIMTLLTTVVAPPLLAFVLGLRGKGVRNEVTRKQSVHTVYTFPSETLRDFIIRELVRNFRSEGFRHSELSFEHPIINFRNDMRTFILNIEGNDLDFESSVSEVITIKTIMAETLVELSQTMGKLNAVIAAASEISPEEVLLHDAAVAGDGGTLSGIKNILRPGCVIGALTAETVSAAISELVNRLAEQRRLLDPARCERDVLSRERATSTCLPGGIALPHCRTSGTGKLVAAIGISAKGCRRDDDPSGELMHIFVLTLCPRETEGPYLQFIAHIAKILCIKSNVEYLKQIKTAEKVRKLFLTGKIR